MSPSTVKSLHDAACDRGEPAYNDPESGLFVLTELFLRNRGYCCRRGCRHCPWRDQKVSARPAAGRDDRARRRSSRSGLR